MNKKERKMSKITFPQIFSSGETKGNWANLKSEGLGFGSILKGAAMLLGAGINTAIERFKKAEEDWNNSNLMSAAGHIAMGCVEALPVIGGAVASIDRFAHWALSKENTVDTVETGKESHHSQVALLEVVEEGSGTESRQGSIDTNAAVCHEEVEDRARARSLSLSEKTPQTDTGGRRHSFDETKPDKKFPGRSAQNVEIQKGEVEEENLETPDPKLAASIKLQGIIKNSSSTKEEIRAAKLALTKLHLYD